MQAEYSMSPPEIIDNGLNSRRMLAEPIKFTLQEY